MKCPNGFSCSLSTKGKCRWYKHNMCHRAREQAAKEVAKTRSAKKRSVRGSRKARGYNKTRSAKKRSLGPERTGS